MEEITKESFRDSLEKDIEEAGWAQKFSDSEDWKKVAKYISDDLASRPSPYGLDEITQIKFQGGYITGITFIERLLNELVDKGKQAQEILKTNPNAE